MTSVTFTTKDGETNVGNPFILGFTSDKTDESLLFSETYDLELPPPPPPPLANGLPDTSNYTTQLFVTVTGVNAYEYYIPELITTEQSIQFAVRKSEGGNVTFTYDNSQIGQIFSKLEIVGGSSVSIDLLTNTAVSGVTIDGTTNTVTLASLGDGEYYTMNVQKVVEGPSENVQNILFESGYTWFSLYVTPSPNTVGSAFTSPIVNTQLLSQTSNTKYTSNFFGSSWNNSSFTFDNKSMYIAFIEAPSTYNLVVTGNTDTSVSINLVAGWNWISYPSTISKTVGTLISNQEANDQILSQTSNTKYTSNFFGSSWNNSSFTFDPNIGYKYFSVSPKVLIINKE